jgi:hypothetical protein
MVIYLRSLGHEVYDFRNPRTGGPNDPRALEKGFHWSEIDPEWQTWEPGQYRRHLLGHQLAADGFAGDWSAMNWADTGVLLLPCGRSAHLEAGYFVGHPDKELHILLQPGREGFEPELMYLLGAGLHVSVIDLADALERPVLESGAAW